jgi:hypothetical protein
MSDPKATLLPMPELQSAATKRVTPGVKQSAEDAMTRGDPDVISQSIRRTESPVRRMMSPFPRRSASITKTEGNPEGTSLVVKQTVSLKPQEMTPNANEKIFLTEPRPDSYLAEDSPLIETPGKKTPIGKTRSLDICPDTEDLTPVEKAASRSLQALYVHCYDPDVYADTGATPHKGLIKIFNQAARNLAPNQQAILSCLPRHFGDWNSELNHFEKVDICLEYQARTGTTLSLFELDPLLRSTYVTPIPPIHFHADTERITE